MIRVITHLGLQLEKHGGDLGFDVVLRESSASRLDTTLTVQTIQLQITTYTSNSAQPLSREADQSLLSNLINTTDQLQKSNHLMQQGNKRQIIIAYPISQGIQKTDKLVNDLILDLLRTRVRLPPPPPFYYVQLVQKI